MPKQTKLNRKIKHILIYLLIAFAMGNTNLYGKPDSNGIILSDSVLTKLEKQEPYLHFLQYQQPIKESSHFRAYIEQFLRRLFENKITYSFSNVLPYLILLLVIILIILKVNNLTLSSLLKPQNSSINNQPFFNENESIQAVDFNRLIASAIENKLFRDAIRYSYLKLLQHLNKNNLIQWGKQKSNYEYLLSTRSSAFYKEFNLATRVYENAWYGEIPWNNSEYQKQFEQMQDLLNNINSKIDR